MLPPNGLWLAVFAFRIVDMVLKPLELGGLESDPSRSLFSEIKKLSFILLSTR